VPLNATDRDGQGLGLALVREAVRQLGGEITLTIEVGTGSCFALSFPLPGEDHELAHPPVATRRPAIEKGFCSQAHLTRGTGRGSARPSCTVKPERQQMLPTHVGKRSDLAGYVRLRLEETKRERADEEVQPRNVVNQEQALGRQRRFVAMRGENIS